MNNLQLGAADPFSSSSFITIAVDAMGADKAPEVTLRGVIAAAQKLKDVKFLVFGDSARLIPLMKAIGNEPAFASIASTATLRAEPAVPEAIFEIGPIIIHHAAEEVLPTDKLLKALKLKSSSMRLAIEAVSAGRAAGVVSAGNTGAYMAMSKLILKSIPGISRPAIARAMPTLRKKTLVLDLGANVECQPLNYLEFAIMGGVYARVLFNTDKPKIGLLNIGSEDVKGSAVVQEAAKLLMQFHQLDLINYYGFVEGDDIARGTVDVVVTDGFTGNVMLKSIEGTAYLITSFLRQALQETWFSRLGALIAAKALKKFKSRIDPREYNGAIFLGLNGIALKSHGGTDAYGFACAIEEAYNLIKMQVVSNITSDLEKILPNLPSAASPEPEEENNSPTSLEENTEMPPVLPA